MGRALKNSTTVRFTTVIKVVVFCIFIGGSGLGYVWQQQQNQALQKRLEELREERFTLENRLSPLQARKESRFLPGNIGGELERRGIDLRPVEPGQVIYLVDPNAVRNGGQNRSANSRYWAEGNAGPARAQGGY